MAALSATLLLATACCLELSASQLTSPGEVRAFELRAVLAATPSDFDAVARVTVPQLASDGRAVTVASSVAADAAAAAPVPAATPAPIDTRIAAVQAFLAGRPLEPYAADMVAAADAAGIDWRLLPTIAMLESGAGTAACGNNAYGYAACAQDFASPLAAIQQVAQVLAGGPYQGLGALTKLCVWVGGTRCTTAHEADYQARAAGLFATLDALRAG